MDAFRQKAWEMILTPGVREAFDLSKESDKTKDAYGRDPVGQSMLLARRLVEAGTRLSPPPATTATLGTRIRITIRFTATS